MVAENLLRFKFRPINIKILNKIHLSAFCKHYFDLIMID